MTFDRIRDLEPDLGGLSAPRGYLSAGLVLIAALLLGACTSGGGRGGVECQAGEALTCTCPNGEQGSRPCVDGLLSTTCMGCSTTDVTDTPDTLSDVSGTDGTDGTNGTDGTDGTDATDATSGTDGTDQTDGGDVIEPDAGPDTSAPDTSEPDTSNCTPDCTGKECGDDGCGGTCGTCPGAAPFCLDNLCQVECVPQCGGLECGPDGCGGSCGTCDTGELCTEGTCVCTPDCTEKQCGDDGCGGSCGTCETGTGCSTNFECVCLPSCVDKACGDDGCGGVCGVCDDGQVCNSDSQCECVPSCDGKTCGPDGCGGSCGTCTNGDTCSDAGVCECNPQCGGKNCGPDGCGGSCGTCGVGQSCSFGICTDGCTPNCTDKTCGPDGCGGTCGSCPLGADCINHACVTDCMPNCTGKSCGSDGCGGSCGVCGVGDACFVNVCATAPPGQISVIFLGAIAGPSKADGTPWDGPGSVSESQFEQLWSALTGNDPIEDVLDLLETVFGGLEKPDLLASVEYAAEGTYTPGSGGDLVTSDENEEDTFTPAWPGGPGYGSLTFHEKMKFRVTLTDEDIALDDPMGIAEIHAGHVADAYWSIGAYPVPVFDQTDNQILFLDIEVGCATNCDGRQCGDDGCGGSCGTCPSQTECSAEGQCKAASCGDVSIAGCCDGDDLYWCEGGELRALDCSGNPSCGWSSDNSWYDCGTDGSTDPGGFEPGVCPF